MTGERLNELLHEIERKIRDNQQSIANTKGEMSIGKYYINIYPSTQAGQVLPTLSQPAVFGSNALVQSRSQTNTSTLAKQNSSAGINKTNTSSNLKKSNSHLSVNRLANSASLQTLTRVSCPCFYPYFKGSKIKYRYF
jgi:hypothetical protein